MARRAPRWIGAGVALVVIAAVAPACGGGGSGPDHTVSRYVAAWEAQDYAAMAKLVATPPSDFEQYHRDLLAEVRATELTSEPSGPVTEDGDHATVGLRHTFRSPPWGDWVRTGELDLVKRDDTWKVRWSPRVIDTALAGGTRYSTDVTWPERAGILGAGGQALTVLAPMTRVGVQGSRITDPAPLTAALTLAGASPTQIETALKSAAEHPDWFVPVTEISAARYAQIKDAIYPVPGTVFQQFATRAALTPGLGAHVVGSTGPITAELLTSLGAPYGPNDQVGRSGIEAQYERRLAGVPGMRIRLVDGTGKALTTVAEFPVTPGQAVSTTIDPVVQRAAEAALAGLTGEGAIVAIRASTGEILASASVPTTNAYDIALRGQYPPGSTFKIITAAALLANGLTPDSTTSCPATVDVGGQVFRNFEGEAAASLTLTDAFATSCNNAFVNATEDLRPGVLPETATEFGLGTQAEIGVAAYGGSVPTPTGASEQAATAIGQAKVTVSPLAMASVAATVAAGSWHAPRLVSGAPNESVAPVPLDPTVTGMLQNLMAAVVSRGTAAGRGLPAGTRGKTGTAEFGPATPFRSHAWFVGFRNDVAFAVLVPEGGVGGAVAAPIAAQFLGGL